MIRVKVDRNHICQIDSITITGHADAGPHGYDLICAGVSSVSFGAINAVEALCRIQLRIDQSDDGGYLRCTMPDDGNKEQRKKARLLLEGMIVSLKTIEASYSEHIQINVEEVE